MKKTNAPAAIAVAVLATLVFLAAPSGNAAAQNAYEEAFLQLRDSVRFEAYSGSLWGADGALRHGAGNSIDRALLLSRLLAEKGVKTRLAYGRLRGDSLSRVIDLARGLRAADGPRTAIDPAIRKAFEEELSDHYWVQAASGKGWIDLDPTLPDASPGRTITGLMKTYDNMPAHLHQLLEMEINCDFSLDGNLAHSRLLRYVGPVASLLDNPVTLMFVHQDADGFFRYNERGGYRPLLVVNGAVIPAINLEAAVKRAAAGRGGVRPVLEVHRICLDTRICLPGKSAPMRQRMLHTDREPSLSRIDEVTVFLLSAQRTASSNLAGYSFRLREAAIKASAFSRPSFPESLTESDKLEMMGLLTTQRELCSAMAELLLARVEDAAVWLDRPFDTSTGTPSPHLLAVGISPGGGMLRTDIIALGGRAFPTNGTDSIAAAAALFAQGVTASVFEGELLRQLPGPGVVDAAGITIESMDRGERWTAIAPQMQEKLDTLGIGGETRRLMESSLAAGMVLIVPESGTTGGWLAWWELDPNRGAVIGMIAPGTGGAVQGAEVDWKDIASAYSPGFIREWPERLGRLCEAASAQLGAGASSWRRDACSTLPSAIIGTHSVITEALSRTSSLDLAPAVKLLFSVAGRMRLQAELREICP